MAKTRQQVRKDSYIKNREKTVLKQHNYYQRLRLIALQNYSSEVPFCKCCGEKHIEFLALDHINGGGTQHRKEIGKGCRIYVWLMQNGYPDGFQVMCHNCNMAKAFYKVCPHQSKMVEQL